MSVSVYWPGGTGATDQAEVVNYSRSGEHWFSFHAVKQRPA